MQQNGGWFSKGVAGQGLIIAQLGLEDLRGVAAQWPVQGWACIRPAQSVRGM